MITVQDFYSIYLTSTGVTIDSRTIQGGEVFFAFSGENYNAATSALEAIEKGAVAVIVEDEKYAMPEKNIYGVASTLHFLQELAKYHRQQLQIPVIALTGSNGKTTTKELIYAVLSQKYSAQYTQGNLNNHIGVPLTLLSIQSYHEIAIVEMGANHQKEIQLLCEIAQPDYGYITNFGKAHLEGFGGFEGVIKGKTELYDYLIAHDKKIFVNEADSIQIEKTKDYQYNTINFGGDNSEFRFQSFMENHFVGLSFQEDSILSRLTGGYNFTNLCAAVTMGLYFGIEFSKIKKAISQYEPTNMRSQIVKNSGVTLVLDTYNANPSSMEVSLKNFSQFEGHKIAILGDMLELGEESEIEHDRILKMAKSLGINGIFTVGKHFMKVNDYHAFENVVDCMKYLTQKPISAENILLKGSRGMKLETLLPILQ